MVKKSIKLTQRNGETRNGYVESCGRSRLGVKIGGKQTRGVNLRLFGHAEYETPFSHPSENTSMNLELKIRAEDTVIAYNIRSAKSSQPASQLSVYYFPSIYLLTMHINYYYRCSVNLSWI